MRLPGSWNRQDQPGDVSKVLTRLERRLDRHAKRCLRRTAPALGRSSVTEPALQALWGLSRLRDQIHEVVENQRHDREATAGSLDSIQRQAGCLASELVGRHSAAPRAALVEAQRLVCLALHALGDDYDALPQKVLLHDSPSPTPAIRFPTELLAEVLLSLFPAERMAIVSGRESQGSLWLTGAFDVTGKGPETHESHVQADSAALSRALITMDQTGCRFAAWIHSHPGRGPGATHPSTTDRKQYEWLVNSYSRNLIAMIAVADRLVRIWGGLNTPDGMTFRFEGQGVEAIPGESNVYRVTV